MSLALTRHTWVFSSRFSSSVSVATSDSNGTFIDLLKMAVFNVSVGHF